MENKTELMQLRHPDYDRELTELVRSNLSPKAFREKLLDYHENDIAAALETLTLSERQRIYHALDAAELSAVLEYAEPMTAYLNELSLRRRVNVLSRMDADAAVDYLKTLESSEKNTLVELMDEPKRREIARLWVYGEDETGSIMTTNCIVIPEGLSVKAAMHQLVEQAAEHDNISTIYVVDADNAFYGAIDLKDLIIAREGDPLAELIATSYPYVYAHERIEDALPRIQDYSEDSIPVLDEENRLLGVVTAQGLVQTVDDALSEDYARLAGLSAEEDLNETLVQSVRKRLPWLLVLLGLGMVVSSVVGLFESVVAQLTLIVCFQSLVLDMAGNVGTQSLAVTIRVLMDSETTGTQKRKLVWKEARVGLMNGAILGAASFALIGAYLLLRGEAALMAFGVSGCIGIALIAAMLLSSISGTVIPIFFKKIGVDPAVASGPLITTVNVLVAAVPCNVDRMAHRAFYAGRRGGELFRHRRIKHFRYPGGGVRVADREENPFTQILITLDMRRYADLVENVGDGAFQMCGHRSRRGDSRGRFSARFCALPQALHERRGVAGLGDKICRAELCALGNDGGIDKSGENEHRRRILPSGKPAENSEPIKPLLDEVQQHNIRACRLDQGKGLQPVR